MRIERGDCHDMESGKGMMLVDKMRDGPNAGVVLKVHVWLAAGAQACREVFADVTGSGGKDICIVCMG